MSEYQVKGVRTKRSAHAPLSVRIRSRKSYAPLRYARRYADALTRTRSQARYAAAARRQLTPPSSSGSTNAVAFAATYTGGKTLYVCSL